jgi:predicted RNase H-like HicB family nuclease
MIKKIFKKNKLNNILRVVFLVEFIVIIILSVIAFSTKNAFLFRVLLYIGGITAFFAMSLLFLELTGIIDTNPERIFNIVIEKEEDEKSYFIHCPQLQGCATQGDSIEDALLMFSDALNVYMKSVIKHNDKIKI